MTLPDAARLLACGPEAFAALGDRIRAIGLAAYLAGALRTGERLDDALRAPMRVWLARRRPEVAAVAMRVLVLGDPARREEVARALGDVAVFLDAGLLVETEGGVASPFRLAFAGDKLVFSDDLRHGEGAVMGPAGTTMHLAGVVHGSARVANALDVGTGAGSLALLLADRASRVVATDVNPRALVLAQVNAWVNRVRNVELREGDLFAPVAGETFDLVVSQPPFVACPDGDDAPVFLAGGARGDEVALRLFSKIGDALAPDGRAFVLVDWPLVSKITEGIEARVRRAIPEIDLNVLLLQSPARNLEDHCALHAAAAHSALGPEFFGGAIAMRDHLEAMGVIALSLTLHVLARAPAPPGWTSTVLTRHFVDAPPTEAVSGRAYAARALLAAGERALRRAKLRIPPGARADAPREELRQVVVHVPEDCLVPAVVLSLRAWEVARQVDAAPSVGAALEGEADALGFLQDVERVLLAGALEVL